MHLRSIRRTNRMLDAGGTLLCKAGWLLTFALLLLPVTECVPPFTHAQALSSLERVTKHLDGYFTSAVWSPDGTRIAAVKDGDYGVGNLQIDIWLMDVDGSNVERVYRGAGRITLAGWLAEDNELLFLEGPDPRSIKPGQHTFPYRFRLFNIRWKTVMPTAQEMFWEAGEHFTWSPDGKRIVFAMRDEEDKQSDLFMMNLDGTNLRQLTDTPDWDENASLVPGWDQAGVLGRSNE